MTSFFNQYLSKIQNLVLNYLLPTLNNLISLVVDVLLVVTINYFPVWKIANYADSYWFLYSNKKITYEVITQLNQK